MGSEFLDSYTWVFTSMGKEKYATFYRRLLTQAQEPLGIKGLNSR